MGRTSESTTIILALPKETTFCAWSVTPVFISWLRTELTMWPSIGLIQLLGQSSVSMRTKDHVSNKRSQLVFYFQVPLRWIFLPLDKIIILGVFFYFYEIFVNLGSCLTSLRDCPYNQGLTTTTITGSKDTIYTCRELPIFCPYVGSVVTLQPQFLWCSLK